MGHSSGHAPSINPCSNVSFGCPCAPRSDCYFECVTAWQSYIKKHKSAIRFAMARGVLPYEATDKALYIDPADLERLMPQANCRPSNGLNQNERPLTPGASFSGGIQPTHRDRGARHCRL